MKYAKMSYVVGHMEFYISW